MDLNSGMAFPTLLFASDRALSAHLHMLPHSSMPKTPERVANSYALPHDCTDSTSDFAHTVSSPSRQRASCPRPLSSSYPLLHPVSWAVSSHRAMPCSSRQASILSHFPRASRSRSRSRGRVQHWLIAPKTLSSSEPSILGLFLITSPRIP